MLVPPDEKSAEKLVKVGSPGGSHRQVTRKPDTQRYGWGFGRETKIRPHFSATPAFNFFAVPWLHETIAQSLFKGNGKTTASCKGFVYMLRTRKNPTDYSRCGSKLHAYTDAKSQPNTLYPL